VSVCGGETEGCSRCLCVEERQRLWLEETQEVCSRVCVEERQTCLCVEERQEVCSRVCVEERQTCLCVEERQRLCVGGETEVCSRVVLGCLCRRSQVKHQHATLERHGTTSAK
jgi:hypothetical protein